MQFYHSPTGVSGAPPTEYWGTPWDPKIFEKCTCTEACAKGGAETAPREATVRQSAPKVRPRLQNLEEMGGKMEAWAPPKAAFS